MTFQDLTKTAADRGTNPPNQEIFLTLSEGGILALPPQNFAAITSDDFGPVKRERLGGIRLAPHVVFLSERPVGEKLVLGKVELE